MIKTSTLRRDEENVTSCICEKKTLGGDTTSDDALRSLLCSSYSAYLCFQMMYCVCFFFYTHMYHININRCALKKLYDTLIDDNEKCQVPP